MSDINCPFYGYSLNYKPWPEGYAILLWPTGANQCALETAQTIPCHMEMDGEVPDHIACPLVQKVQTPPGPPSTDIPVQEVRRDAPEQ